MGHGEVAPLVLTLVPDLATTGGPGVAGRVAASLPTGARRDTVRVVQTDHTVTYSLTFLESSPVILKAVYGEDNVVETDGLVTVKVNSDTLEHRSWAFEMKDGDKRIRIFVPDGQIISRGEITYTHSGAIQYEVTIEAFPDANGDKAIKVLETATP